MEFFRQQLYSRNLKREKDERGSSILDEKL